jgi:4-hydroxybenzoate polyprenyltransferase
MARMLAFPSLITFTKRLLFDVSTAALTYGYVFDIANQTMAVEEDAINKPYRPIPAGLLSVEGARLRWAFSWCLFPLVLAALSGPGAGALLILWEIWVAFCYVWPKPNHWFFRNSFSGAGQVILLRLLNEVVRNNTPDVDMRLDLDIWNAAFIMATVHVQEFHDVDGDRRTGRKTLPLLLATKGVIRLRQATAMALIAGSCMFLAWGWLNCGPGKVLNLHLFGILQVIAGLGTAIRLISPKSKTMDEITYKYCYASVFLFLEVYLVQLNTVVC